MNSLDIKTRIMYELRSRREASPQYGWLDVPSLARELGESAKVVAVLSSDLARAGHVDGDGNMLGFVRISDRGIAYMEAVDELHGDTPESA